MEHLYEAHGFKTTVLHRQYGYFKHRPGETLIGTRVKLMTLKPGDFASKSNHEQGGWDSLDTPDDISTEKYLKYHLEEKLRSSPAGDSLQICFLILDFGKTQHQLSFWHGAIETFLLCQRDLYLAPARVIIQCIESAWDLNSTKSPVPPQLTSDQLPSKESPKSIGILSNDTEKTYSLHWQKELLDYRNDLYVYVWQPHLERTPSARYNSATSTAKYNSATVVIPPLSLIGASSAHRLLVIADPPCLMSRFLRTETAFVRSTQTQHTWNATHEKLRILAILLKWVVEDSSNLVDDMTSKAREMTYRGRRMPTRSKIQYLIHLDDCRRLAISDLKHGKTVVDEAQTTMEMVDFCCKKKGGLDEAMAIKAFSSFHEDFDFLIMKFEALKTTLATAREQINEQISLSQDERALILTIAAAFFIPLSFIAVSSTDSC
ncbi:uncharacterized protein M437DRAFT_49158 [Aureobasidium melanogenum CBS 110374]|uniref:Uncharacterized protein n=1 Tax=Aureobasidium melanogenum (strain CBS 110374) TaxID=1043003 RepID=A0A074VSX9_AURM1|nr:uncharacterized protein M437DRAFT_49158 [Aureobasidium melanogenum CBS 110374]KEQ62349.1 hypothetical protein M437DRAFT_49158 [Aureobasidium melanogenum CBS 110374]